MLHLTEIKGVDNQIAHLKNGNTLDMSLSNGVIRSSKEARAYQDNDGEWLFWVVHEIDGTISNFTEAAFKDVLRGKRDIWDGDLPDGE